MLIGKSKSGHFGGKAKAKKIRDAYLQNPKLCKNCGKPMIPKEGQKLAAVKRKNFCSQSCAASFNNAGVSRNKVKKYCSTCSKEIQYSGTYKYKKCDDCLLHSTMPYRTKGDMLNKHKYERARKIIRAHAYRIYKASGKPLVCIRCGYSHFAEVCHIKPVSLFSNDALIVEINDINNLMALCPNCHWEYDNGIFQLN